MKLFFSPEALGDISRLNKHLESTGTLPGTAIEFYVNGKNDDGTHFTKKVWLSQAVEDGLLTVEFTS